MPTKQLRHVPADEKIANRPFSCIGELLAHYGQIAAAREAILAPGRAAMSYGALRAWAKDIVRELRRVGVDRSDRVAVVLPDGPDTAATMMSVAAGAVCVPLNPSFTADEWQRYFDELRVAALLTRPDIDSAGPAVAHALGIPVLDLPLSRGGLGPFNGPLPSIDDEDFASAADDAFILLTSGSTSRPKMVPLTHASVCQSAHNVGAVLALDSRDRLLSVLPLFHGHGLISGVLAALAAGSSVVCTPGFDAAAFFGWLTAFRPTWYTAVPPIHQAVWAAAKAHKRQAEQSSLRLIRSASSTLPPKVVCGLEALFGVPVIDTFGMTEAATQIAANPLEARKLGSVGRSAGAEIAILDGEGRHLSSGEHGEVALRGPTITTGYCNDPAATEAAFRDGWFRTGDLGYLDADGFLFLVGRIKDVINKGGQKVSPGEVEEVLLAHPEVLEAVVFAVPHERSGADVAAAVVLRPRAKVSPQKLREFARKRLARFKVPSFIRFVPEIPKGPAGKIKRSELPAALSMTSPSARADRAGTLLAPRSDLERQLADIWMDALELDHIGMDEDVFALGADSLAVTDVLLRLSECLGAHLSFEDIADAPTISALAARLNSARRNPAAATLSDVPEAAVDADGQPVAIVQERMLRIERDLPGLPQFNLPFAYRLKGPLNVAALERSLAELMRRHDALRTRFAWRKEGAVAHVLAPRDVKPPLIVQDLAAGGPAGNASGNVLLLKKAELAVEQECWAPIDAHQPPLFRACLLRLGADDHVLLLIMHDLIIDGWSMAVFMEELADVYTAFTAGRPAPPREPAAQLSQFVRWQDRWLASDAARQQLAYWNERLRNASPVFPIREGDSAAELTARVAQERFRISNDLMARLSAMSQNRGATLFMTLLTAFKALLLLRSGRNDICVATMMANRAQPGTQRLIGPLANTTLIRTRMDADLSFREALARVRGAVLEAYARQELPFDVIARRLAEEHGMDPASLVQFYFVLQVGFRRPIELPDVSLRRFGQREGQSVVMPVDRTWMKMTLRETPSGMAGTCRYKKHVFKRSTVRAWLDDYKTILAHVATNPDAALGRLAGVLA